MIKSVSQNRWYISKNQQVYKIQDYYWIMESVKSYQNSFSWSKGLYLKLDIWKESALILNAGLVTKIRRLIQSLKSMGVSQKSMIVWIKWYVNHELPFYEDIMFKTIFQQQWNISNIGRFRWIRRNIQFWNVDNDTLDTSVFRNKYQLN
jgi:hypothetical protein